MPRPLLPLFVLLLLTAGSLSPRPAGAAEEFSIAAEIDALTVAVNRLATVIEQQQKAGDTVEVQKLTQAIAYLNLRWRRIERLERDLDAARTMREDFELSAKNLGERARALEEQLQNSQGNERDELSHRLEDFQLRSEMMRKRVTRAEEEIVLLENRARELQDELVDIETYVQQHLKF